MRYFCQVPTKLTVVFICLLINCCFSDSFRADFEKAKEKQQSKDYCMLLSLHYLDHHTDTFAELTAGFGKLKQQVFKYKLADKLSLTCQQQISPQQLNEIAQLLGSLKTKGKQFTLLGHKYIQYFKPGPRTIHDIFEEVSQETDAQINAEIKKVHQAREKFQHHSKKLSQGLEYLGQHTKHKTKHLFDTFEKVEQNLGMLAGKLINLGKEVYRKVIEHPHVENLKEFFKDEDL